MAKPRMAHRMRTMKRHRDEDSEDMDGDSEAPRTHKHADHRDEGSTKAHRGSGAMLQSRTIQRTRRHEEEEHEEENAEDEQGAPCKRDTGVDCDSWKDCDNVRGADNPSCNAYWQGNRRCTCSSGYCFVDGKCARRKKARKPRLPSPTHSVGTTAPTPMDDDDATTDTVQQARQAPAKPAENSGNVDAIMSAVGSHIKQVIDCDGDWTQWSACSVTCGGGKKFRNYTIKTWSQGGGEYCKKFGETTCTCNIECPVDCAGEWAQWEACSHSCGEGVKRRRFVAVQDTPRSGGQPCPVPQQRQCNDADCEVDCDGYWGEWGACSTTCQQGSEKGHRMATFHMTRHRENGGKECPPPYTRTEECNAATKCMSCDGEWGEWTPCTASCGQGSQMRMYKFRDGIAFPFCPQNQTRQCGNSCCPVDCQGEWGAWGQCSQTCGENGAEKRTFRVQVHDSCGGKPCPTGSQTRACHLPSCPTAAPTPPPPEYENCTGDWNDWGQCSTTCGAGQRMRRYVATSADSCGNCPQNQTGYCNRDVCCAENCEGDWSCWSNCTAPCGGGTQYRVYKVTKEAQCGGTACPHDTQSRPCNTEECTVDCRGTWSDWDDCSPTCGDGLKRSYFHIIQYPDGGGKACPQSPRTEVCNKGACEDPCEGTWGEWSDCDSTCGGGSQIRKFRFRHNGNSNSPGTGNSSENCHPNCRTEETRACATEIDCPVDCQGSWSGWGCCTKTCGGGFQVRVFEKTREALNGGNPCPSSPAARECNKDDCPEPSTPGPGSVPRNPDKSSSLSQQEKVTVCSRPIIFRKTDGPESPFDKGQYGKLQTDYKDFKDNNVNELEIPEGCSATLFDQSDFKGPEATFGPGKHSAGQVERELGKSMAGVGSLKVRDDT
eukprot:TRINITY_DN2280_c0_g1_i14.p1 TRINITY_DN2280_c0_g1~~TRINITY_DN2280_c0_g1_i14.p1  ORF type:complete len:884 (-),score=111.02 TRINITY_DN2280_c0_g1_i14:154-2805(-)